MPSRLQFLDQYSSHNTKLSYRTAIKSFLSVVYKTAIEPDELETYANRYFDEHHNHEKDLGEFLAALQGRPPKTVRSAMAIANVFLYENGAELGALFWKRIRKRIKGRRALTMDKVPSQLELKNILEHLPLHGRALFLLLSSSGMRIGEALQLEISDVNLTTIPAKITISGTLTKSGDSRIAFMSSEAKSCIDEWLRVRNSYIKTACGRIKPLDGVNGISRIKNTEDKRLFPFNIGTALNMWHGAVQKAGLFEKDRTTNRALLHPHTLRKFFRTRMATAIPVDIVEAAMGHEAYLTEVYRKYSQQDLADFYLKGESTVMVYSSGAEIKKFNEERGQLQSMINSLVAENQAFKQEFADIKRTVGKINQTVAELIQ